MLQEEVAPLGSTSPRAQRSSLLCRKDVQPSREGLFETILSPPVNTLDSRYSRRLKPRGTPPNKATSRPVTEEFSTLPPPARLSSSSSITLPNVSFLSDYRRDGEVGDSSASGPGSPIHSTVEPLLRPPSPLSSPLSSLEESNFSTPPSSPRSLASSSPPPSRRNSALFFDQTKLSNPSPKLKPSPEKPRGNVMFKDASPVKQVYSDRYIPSRSGSNLDGTLALAPFHTDKPLEAKDESHTAYSMLLRNELLKDVILPPLGPSSGCKPPLAAPSPSRTFRFKSPTKGVTESPYTVSPLGADSQHLIVSPKKAQRKILKSPSKVLDAPALLDDFYLNLVDWSAQNVLAVGLSNCVYTWSACTSKVQKLCDLEEDSVTSVGYSQRGNRLAVGTRTGFVQIWDMAEGKMLRTLEGHSARVGALSWSGQVLASGSRDRSILLHDTRTPEPFCSKLVGHKQEVCGLKWSPEGDQLASGGNDNKLLIWDAHSTSPIARFGQHTAAVKAIAWSPHQHGLLASGGGTADRHIRFWNTLTCSAIEARDTGSQVCNLMWSKTVNEIVSTHGFSLNQIIVWKYPSMTQVATLTGHTFRVLYLAMSPDGQTIVTGAGDETLRFWNLFPGTKSKGVGASELFFPNSSEIR